VPTKKLQIFISSTYTDLISERQAVVEAILMAGHIPAGMELFAAGDKSQLETIRRWIKESDVFMLILGGRYGSIEESTGKSYIQLEYEYALEQGRPVFAAVISEKYLNEKIKADGNAALETEHSELYQSFRKTVLSRVCRFFDDKKDLKLVIHESIPEVTRGRELAGWVKGDEILDPKKILEEMSQLQSENARLTKRSADLEKRLTSDNFNGYTFDELLDILKKETISLKDYPGVTKDEKLPLISLFLACAKSLAVGVANFMNMNEGDKYIFFNLAPRLSIYGLAEKKTVNNRGVQRFQLSAAGSRFLAKAQPLFREAQSNAEVASDTTRVTPAQSSARRVRSSRRAGTKKE
jgi:hypothetical protein